MTRRRSFLAAAAAAAFAVLIAGSPQAAADIPAPDGAVILTVTGLLQNGNGTDGEGDLVARFDRAMLRALPQHELETHTDWTEGLQTFEGPLLRDLLDEVGASGSQIRASALNDYSVVFPRSDVEEFVVLLAMRQNGRDLRVRDKGPIWIIYPNETASDTFVDPNSSKMIWQLTQLELF